MQWEFIVALVIAIPLILFPVAFIWYLNIGGIYDSIKKARARRASREARANTEAEPHIATAVTKGEQVE